MVDEDTRSILHHLISAVEALSRRSQPSPDALYVLDADGERVPEGEWYAKRAAESVDAARTLLSRGDPEQDWYFTFPVDHEHAHGYVLIHGTEENARAEMVRRYGEKWGFQCASAEEAGVERFGLREVDR